MTNTFLFLLGISVSIGLIVIALLLLSPFLNKRYAAKWKYLIWIFLALRLVIPFGITNGPDLTNHLSQAKTKAASGPGEKNTDHPADTATPYRRIVVEIPAQMAAPIQAPSENNHTGITGLDIAVFVWIMGCISFLSVHVISYLHYKRQVAKRGNIAESVQILSQMSQLKRELHIKRAIPVIEYSEAESPMMIGFRKPLLILPKEQYSSEELFFILKHELVHFKRGDVYLKLLFVAANAVHWFNPLIWMMHKQAVIDMELSCDERVTQGTSFAVRKAYTETLLSMLHKRCARRTALSTQFYGGTNVMKKRFQNILMKGRKKNGIFLLIGTVMLTICLGTLLGCSISEGDAKNNNTGNADTEHVSGQPEQAPAQTGPAPAAPSSAGGSTAGNTTLLTFSKEGEQEQKTAVLAVGDGYSFYLPDDEWQQSDSDVWTAAANEQIRLWVTHFEDESMDSVAGRLEADGYVAEEDDHMWKQEGDLICHVKLNAFENDVWGIFYSYPADFEEGWGRELPVIADTFARSETANGAKNNGPGEAGAYLDVQDCQEIRTIAAEFAAAYFAGDIDTMQKFLSSTYAGAVDRYESTGSVSDLTVKGLSDADEKKIENGRYGVSLEFRDSTYEDMFLYLTLGLIKEGGDWNIEFYGVEG